MFAQKISLIIILLDLIQAQSPSINIFLSLQNQNQSYYSYLPYIDTCDYNQQNLNSGQVSIEKLGPLQFYDKINYQQQLTFWGVVANGFQLSALILEHLEGYDGYILYDSKVQNFQRDLIYFNISFTQLNFSYVLPTIDPQTLQITLTFNKNITIALTTKAEVILQNCQNITYSNFAYIGQNTFLFVCGSTKDGFTFVPDGNSSQIALYNFSLNFTGNNYKLVTNPELYDLILKQKYNKLIFWNCLLLSEQGSQYNLYYIDYNSTSNSLNISNLTQRKVTQTLMMDRIWGLQEKSQVSKWMDVYSSLNKSEDITFPGDIISVFVSSHNNIFVECAVQGGLNYLLVFQSSGGLYWNYSFNGSVVYYGTDATFIYNQDDDSLYLAQVSRPYIILNSSFFPNESKVGEYTYYNFSVPCQFINFSVFYTIFWTSISYPTYLIESLDNSSIYSNDSIFAVPSSSRFMIIGPGFQFIPDSPPNIDAEVIDSSTFYLNDRAIGIVNIQPDNSGGFGIIVATNSTIYIVGLSNNIKILAYMPCGFNNITSARLTAENVYEIINQANQTCICVTNFSNCYIQTNNNVNQGSIFSPPLTVINNGSANQTVVVKKNLYGIVNQGTLGTILENNSVLLINLKTRQVTDMITMPCNPNSTNGIIFTRQFNPPFLVLFCEGTGTISQYIILNDSQIVFKRIIPIYGFKTRTGLHSIRSAIIYILIQVDLDNTTIMISPFPENCCVLKLNFRYFTVSVIQEIIKARTLLATSFYKNYDIALLETQTPSGEYQTIVKIYFLNQWFIFNYTNYDEVIAQNVIIPISFWSPFYNFGSYYNFSITFNLTRATLNLTKENKKKRRKEEQIQITLYKSETNLQEEWQSGTISYNLSQYICGPIFNSIFTRSSKNQNDVLIIQDNILTSYKKIGSSGLQFIQIINPQVWGYQDSYFSFTNILLFITVDTMYVYGKIINNVQLVYITNFTLPERSCTYTLYKIINSTSVILNSDCYGIDFTFQTPLLTLNYDQTNNLFTYSSVFIEVSLALTHLQTIPFNETTYLIGLIEGPMNAETGKLVLCANLTSLTCTPLFISTKYQFLIDFATFLSSNGLYFVMTIDPKYICVYIEPRITNSSNVIPANFTFIYSNVIPQQFCSTIRVLNVTGMNSFVILTCTYYYYLLLMNFTNNLTSISQKFARYSQCDLYDTVKPEVITLPGQGLKVLFTQCRQNDYTLQLNVYDRTRDQAVIISTGYLQMFLLTGPLGPNCQQDSISPIRVIPVSSSTSSPLFVAYKMQTTHKFIYAQLQGILIDNFLSLEPQIDVIFRPRTVYFDLPKIDFIVFNDFSHKIQQIITVNQKAHLTENFVNVLVFIAFIIANLLTLLFLISYYILREINNTNEEEEQELQDLKFEDIELKSESKKSKKKKQKQNRKSAKHEQQIQMFFIKTNQSKTSEYGREPSEYSKDPSLDRSLITE